MSPITRGLFRTRKIWIDEALGGAARCRRVALRQRRVAAFVIVGPPAVHMQANWISRIVRLGASRCRCQNRRDRQNRQSRNAHQSLLRICAAQHTVRAQNVFRIASSVSVSTGFSDRKQTGPLVPSQFTFARWQLGHSTNRMTRRRFNRSSAWMTSFRSRMASRRSTVRVASRGPGSMHSPKMRRASSTARTSVSWSGLFMPATHLR